MARLLGAATPLVPPSVPVPRHPQSVFRRSPWDDDSPSAVERPTRHQGPPALPRHSPSNDSPDTQHEFDAVPPPAAHDGGHPRRNFGSRPAMRGRCRMHAPAATATAMATRSAEQPAMPSQFQPDRSEAHSEVSIHFIS